MFMSVVLPAPFSPSRPWISPRLIARVMSEFAVRRPNRFVMPTRRRSGTPEAPSVLTGMPRVEALDAPPSSPAQHLERVYVLPHCPSLGLLPDGVRKRKVLLNAPDGLVDDRRSRRRRGLGEKHREQHYTLLAQTRVSRGE